MPGRSWSDASRAYRYGFNGKEKDFETANDNYDFGARIYDGRLGRWLSVDPESGEYHSFSPYNGIGNSPIYYIDIDGNKIIIAYEQPKTDENGNFVVDQATGNLVMETKYFEYRPGLTPPDNEFVKKTIEAINYISQSRTGRRNVRRAINNPKEITIVEIDPYKKYLKNTSIKGTHAEPFKGTNKADGFHYDQDNDGNLIFVNMIYWDPSKMLAIEDNNGKFTGKYQSAAVGLAHEFRHINKANRNPWRALRLKGRETGDGYRDAEERRTVRWERRLVRQLNRKQHNDEGKRYNWQGKDTDNKGQVTSTNGIAPKRELTP